MTEKCLTICDDVMVRIKSNKLTSDFVDGHAEGKISVVDTGGPSTFDQIVGKLLHSAFDHVPQEHEDPPDLVEEEEDGLVVHPNKTWGRWT